MRIYALTLIFALSLSLSVSFFTEYIVLFYIGFVASLESHAGW